MATPTDPNPVLWACVHAYHACVRLVEALDQHGGYGACACEDCSDRRCEVYLLQGVAGRLESGLTDKALKVAMKAGARLAKAQCKSMGREKPFPVDAVTFSKN